MRRVIFGSLAVCVLAVATISAAPKTVAPATIELNTFGAARMAGAIWPSLGDSV